MIGKCQQRALLGQMEYFQMALPPELMVLAYVRSI